VKTDTNKEPQLKLTTGETVVICISDDDSSILQHKAQDFQQNYAQATSNCHYSQNEKTEHINSFIVARLFK
jgi:hypothetical protein